LVLNGREFTGRGGGKQEAEQNAAKVATENVEIIAELKVERDFHAGGKKIIVLLIDFGSIGYKKSMKFKKHIQVWAFLKATDGQKAAQRNQNIWDRFPHTTEQYDPKNGCESPLTFLAGTLCPTQKNMTFYIVARGKWAARVEDRIRSWPHSAFHVAEIPQETLKTS